MESPASSVVYCLLPSCAQEHAKELVYCRFLSIEGFLKNSDDSPRCPRLSVKELSQKWSRLKVALVHDWLLGTRGGERVFELLCGTFPQASVLTLLYKREVSGPMVNAHRVRTSFLQWIPRVERFHRYLLPLMPMAIESLALPDADLVVSSSHCVAKGVRPKPGTRHLCYCHSPMRYAWGFKDEYFGHRTVKSVLATPMLAALRRWDRTTSSRVDRFVANSMNVKRRIRKYYGRDADVVHPPVDTEHWTPGGRQPGDFDLVVSGLSALKRVDLAVRAYTTMGRKLLIVGEGPMRKQLEGMGGPSVKFLGRLRDDEILDLYRSCRLLVFPGVDDFGMVPVEVQACGRPVVAFACGGALETVKSEVTGFLFHEQTEDALIDAVEKCEAYEWNPEVIRSHALDFGIEAFLQGLSVSIKRCLGSGGTEKDQQDSR